MPIIKQGFAGSVVRRCSECGKVLGPLDKIHVRGALDVCDACFQRLKATDSRRKEQDEQSFLALVETIKQCFGVNQVPKKLLYQVDRLIESDPRKNYNSIAYTLNYAFLRMGVLDPEGGLAGVVNFFYEDAAKHYAKTKEVFAYNTTFVPTEHTTKIQMPRNSGKTLVFKPKTNIEDL